MEALHDQKIPKIDSIHQETFIIHKMHEKIVESVAKNFLIVLQNINQIVFELYGHDHPHYSPDLVPSVHLKLKRYLKEKECFDK